MSSTSTKTADELRDERFERYLKAAGLETAEPLYKSAGMSEWLAKNAFPHNDELSVFLACPVYRMLKRLDSISVKSDPLGLKKPPKYEALRGEAWIRYCIQSKIRGISAVWGGSTTQPRLSNIISMIRNRINELTQGNFRVDEPEEKYETFAGGFEQIPTLGLFPFYLHKERLRNWHVLPFANLIELGMVMNEDLARAVLPQEHLTSLSGSDDEITITIDEMRTIISNVEMNNNHRFLYLGGGHAAYRIILNSLEADEYGLLRMNLDDIHTVLPSRPKAFDLKRILTSSSATRYILLSDIGDPLYSTLRTLYSTLRRGKKSNRNGLVWVRIKLNEPVPVGIGFSLFTMAKVLIMPELLREISDILLRNLEGDATFISALKNEGVELNNKYLEYLKLLTQNVSTPISEETEVIKEDELQKLKEALYNLLEEARGLAIAGNQTKASSINNRVDAVKLNIEKIVDRGILESKLEKAKLIPVESRPTHALEEWEKLFPDS